MRIYHQLLDPQGGGGGGIDGTIAFNPATMAPEDVRSEPSLAAIKTVNDLAKGYVHAQKLIGAKRIAIPGENASETEWSQFYNSIGRPETPDKYGVPEVEVDPSLKPDATKLAEVKKMFHDAGLTPKQVNRVMEYYMKTMDSNLKTARAAQESSSAQAINGLRQEWGDKFGSNVDIAKSVIKKFGDESLGQYLEQSGLGNNVSLVKLLHKIGTSIMEDRTRSGGDGDLPINDQSRAIQEIDKLKADPEFQKQLGDVRQPGHRAAVERWTNLFTVAYPGKSE